MSAPSESGLEPALRFEAQSPAARHSIHAGRMIAGSSSPRTPSVHAAETSVPARPAIAGGDQPHALSAASAPHVVPEGHSGPAGCRASGGRSTLGQQPGEAARPLRFAPGVAVERAGRDRCPPPSGPRCSRRQDDRARRRRSGSRVDRSRRSNRPACARISDRGAGCHSADRGSRSRRR